MTETMNLLMGFQPLAHATRERTTVMVRGQGVFVYDDRGREYLEATSSFYVAALGSSDRELADAAAEQLRTLPFYPSAQYRAVEPALRLADKLASLVPLPRARIAFACSGSEANDFLLKFMRFKSVTGGRERRLKVIARSGSYSGATLASASLTGGHHEEFALPLPGVLHVSQPDVHNSRRRGESPDAFAARLADELEALILREDPETIGAFLTEPIAFSSGLSVPPPTYWPRIQEVLSRYDVDLFADEVVTGFGRTGHWFGSQAMALRPECMTFGKALSGGYFPISAIALSGEFFDALVRGSDKLDGFAHAATHAGHPVGAALALKTIEIIETRGLIAHAREMGAALATHLARYADHPLVTDVRSLGLAGAVEFRRGDDDAGHALAPSSLASKVFCERALEHGLIVRGTGASAVIAPPLVITRAELAELFRRFDLALADTESRVRV
jgi:4-aminobutyrate--pyruvate transaminase